MNYKLSIKLKKFRIIKNPTWIFSTSYGINYTFSIQFLTIFHNFQQFFITFIFIFLTFYWSFWKQIVVEIIFLFFLSPKKKKKILKCFLILFPSTSHMFSNQFFMIFNNLSFISLNSIPFNDILMIFWVKIQRFSKTHNL